MRVLVKIVPVAERYIPEYKTAGAACADAFACIVDSAIIMPGKILKVSLGFSIQLIEGWELQIRSRSGHASKGLLAANGMGNDVGTIDSDYRGPVSVLLYNTTEDAIVIRDGDRIAQVSIQPTHRIVWETVNQLDATERGEGGFGSTGNK